MISTIRWASSTRSRLGPYFETRFVSSYCIAWPKNKFFSGKNNVFDHYLTHYHYLILFQTLFFIFSPRRHPRRRQQYEVIRKIFYETSLSNTKMILSITSIRNNRMFQFIDTRHSTFTFCLVFIFFDLNDDTSLIYEINIFHKLEILLITDFFDRWSRSMNFF
jgi:hypothetical protein